MEQKLLTMNTERSVNMLCWIPAQWRYIQWTFRNIIVYYKNKRTVDTFFFFFRSFSILSSFYFCWSFSFSSSRSSFSFSSCLVIFVLFLPLSPLFSHYFLHFVPLRLSLFYPCLFLFILHPFSSSFSYFNSFSTSSIFFSPSYSFASPFALGRPVILITIGSCFSYMLRKDF